MVLLPWVLPALSLSLVSLPLDIRSELTTSALSVAQAWMLPKIRFYGHSRISPPRQWSAPSLPPCLNPRIGGGESVFRLWD